MTDKAASPDLTAAPMTWRRDGLGDLASGFYKIHRFQSGMRASAVQWILRHDGHVLARPWRLRDAKELAEQHREKGHLNSW